jgi:hypothetical protein
MANYSDEDVGNIILLEHLNVQIPDQGLATLFYVIGLGLTRDPYLTVGLDNMWINVGEQQFHLPTRDAQVVQGHIGLVVPDLELLQSRLRAVEERICESRFGWSVQEDHIKLTCPWGNQFRCYAPAARFGDMALGLAYIEFLVRPGTAESIGRFYEKVLGTLPSELADEGKTIRVKIGRNQSLLFRETDQELLPYDGHHIAIYVGNFSGPYGFLKERGLIMEEVRNHQFRFKEIINPETGQQLFLLEHEVRSLQHPMYHRAFVNRDPVQSQRQYKRGRDALIPFSG